LPVSDRIATARGYSSLSAAFNQIENG